MKLEEIKNTRDNYFKTLAYLEARLEKLDNEASKEIFNHFCIPVFAIRFYNNHITSGGAFSLRGLDDHINRYFYYTNKTRELKISKDGERLHVYRQDCSGERRDYDVNMDLLLDDKKFNHYISEISKEIKKQKEENAENKRKETLEKINKEKHLYAELHAKYGAQN